MGFSLKKSLGLGVLGNKAGDWLKGPSMPQLNAGAIADRDKQNALFNFRLNNNISNPFGSQTLTDDGNGNYSLKQSYAAPIQSSINTLQNALPGYAQTVSSRLADPSGYQNALLSRMDFAGQEEALRNRLANQGLTPGSEAWGKEMDQFQRSQNDARMQAILGAGQYASQDLQNLQGLTSSMYGMAPQFHFTGNNAQLSNPEALQYQNDLDKYNAKMMQRGQIMNGLFSLGSKAAMGA